jgi:hypothetical protein
MLISFGVLISFGLISFGIFVSPAFFGWTTWFSPSVQPGARSRYGHFRNRFASMATNAGMANSACRWAVMVRGDA